MKPLVRHARADKDVIEAIDYYLQHASESSLAFVDALEQAYRNTQRRPGAGSPRYEYELDLPGLRFWRVKRFPYLVFYVETADQISIWRVLHDRRDIPAWLIEESNTR